MVEKQFIDPSDLLAKLDWEGDDGITWFKGDEFEDDELAGLVDDANYYHHQFTEALSAVMKRAEALGATSQDE